MTREQIEEIRGSLLVSLTQEDINALCDLALAALSGVPQGDVMVPVEPTEEMLKAGAAAVRDFYSERGEYPRTHAMWKAMLHSAPASNAGDTDLRGAWTRASITPDLHRCVLVWNEAIPDWVGPVIGYFAGEQWYSGGKVIHVTHWMPLPPPPQARRDEADAQTNEKD